MFRCVQLFVTPSTVVHQAHLSVHGISQQEYWSRVAFPPPGTLPGLGTKPISLIAPALTGRFFNPNIQITKYQIHIALDIQDEI